MTVTLNALQKQRRDTASNWTSNNTVLLAGELGYESDTKKFKIGDGTTAWQSLDYLPIPDTNRLLTGNLTVGGNFTVNGTTTTIDTTTLTVEDKNIEIGKVSTPSDTTADGGGITLKGATDKTINWVDSTDSWTLSEHLNLASGKVLKVAGTQILSATALGSSVVSSSLTSVGTIATGVWNATAISGSKVTPDFGSQNILTTGTFASGDITLTSTQPKIVFNDSDDNPDYQIQNLGGQFKITDNTNSADRLIVNTDGHIDIAGNLDVGAGLDVTGKFTCTGNIDLPDDSDILLGDNDEFRIFHDESGSLNYIQSHNDAPLILKGNNATLAQFNPSQGTILKYNGSTVFETLSTGISVTGICTATSFTGVLNSTVTATTQSASDNSTKVATTAYVDNQVTSGAFMPTTGGSFTGDVTLANQKDLKFAEATANGTNTVGFQAPASVASNILWTLPATDAAVSGYALVSDGSGTLSWAAASGGGATGGGGEKIFHESENQMDNNYTISTNHNAVVPSPLTINATLTIPSGSVVTFV